MAIETKIVTLYQGVDSDTQQAIAPRTKTSAVSDENNVGLDVLLDNIENDVSNKLPITGGTLTGSLGIDGNDKGIVFTVPNRGAHAVVAKNANANGDYGLWLSDLNDAGSKTDFVMQSNQALQDKALLLVDGTVYRVLGENNTYGLSTGKTCEITDWNNAIYTGVYTAPNPNVANNPPSGDYFVGMTYYYSSDYIVQTAYSVTYREKSWMRKRIAGSWTAWGQIAIAEYNSSTNTLNFIM